MTQQKWPKLKWLYVGKRNNYIGSNKIDYCELSLLSTANWKKISKLYLCKNIISSKGVKGIVKADLPFLNYLHLGICFTIQLIVD
jgi:hypothetical protein